jgi:type III secretion protein T
MENADLLDAFATQIIGLAVATSRVAVAFLVLPLFSDEIIPALIRNSIFVAIALIVVAVQPALDTVAYTAMDWLMLFAKELFIGLVIGFFFGIFLWAFEAAGVIIDTQIGASMAMIYDPISGHDVTLLGDFIGRWVNYLFLAAGGLLFLTTAVLESYVLWPVAKTLPNLEQAAVILFEREFSRFVTLVFMLASPVIVVIFIVDLSMGIVNRFSRRLDILFISLALKGLVALLMVALLIPTLADLLITQIDSHRTGLDALLKAVLGGS